ncbi:unnamed protein product, partial [Polarella glacialis]
DRAKKSRIQQETISYMNRDLDRELAALLKTLVCKRGMVKAQSTAPLRVSPTGMSLEHSDGTAAEGPQVGWRPQKAGSVAQQELGTCSICSKKFIAGQAVRHMFCCGALQHASCLQGMLKSEANCPSCQKPVLTVSELKELQDLCC